MEPIKKNRKPSHLVIRSGDWVKIIEPTFFLRCGYPLDFREVYKDIKSNNKQDIETFFEKFGIKNPREDSYRKIIDVLTYETVKSKGFGGRERRIYTSKKSKLKDKLFVVERVKMVMTGDYFPPSGGYDSWSGETDYEYGGLSNQQSHKILYLSSCSAYTNIDYSSLDEIKEIEESRPLAIEERYVEKVLPKNKEKCIIE